LSSFFDERLKSGYQRYIVAQVMQVLQVAQSCTHPL